MNKIILLLVMVFIAVISFFPEPLIACYNSSLELVLALALGLSLYKNKFNLSEYFIKKNGIFWIYLGLISINIWFAGDRLLAYGYYRYFVITAVLVYFLIKNEVRPGNIRIILHALVICAALVAMAGFLELIFRHNLIYEKFVDNYFYSRFIRESRMMSTMMHPNVLGSYLVALVPAAYYFYKEEKALKIKYINLAIFLLILLAIFLTFSRGTWMAGLLMVSLWLLLRKKNQAVFFIWGMFFLVIILLSMPFISDNIRFRYSMDYLFRYLKYSHRVLAYFVTGGMLNSHPFAGIGFGHYRVLFNQYSNAPLVYEIRIPESVYLMHLAEAGLMGFIGFIIFLWNIVRKCLQRYYRDADDGWKKISFSVFMGFTGFLFNMATYDAFLWKTPFYLFWLFSGILAAQEHDMPRSAHQSNPTSGIK